jgi:hypothetical protein
MPLDFKARQIRTAQIIASGSNKTPLIIYGSGSALDYYGSYPVPLLSNVGSDVFLFVSGGIGQKDSTNALSVSVFGGDVVISGTAYNGSGIPYSLGASSAGIAGCVQYSNGAGGFSAESAFIYDSASNKLSADNISITSKLEVSGSTYIGDSVGNDYLYVNSRLKTDIIPDMDRTVSLGSPNYRFANIYTGDLHLRNDRGNWTIVEEEEYLCVVNNLTGKRYKMMLEPLD